MATNPREIRRRIKSVKNISQITKAMELVSAAKMRKAQLQATSSRPYAVLSGELLKDLVNRVGYKHPLIQRVLPEDNPDASVGAGKILVVLISSDKGLAGSLNTNVINKAISVDKLVPDSDPGSADYITVGKKGADAVRRLGYNVIAAFESKDRNISINDAKSIAKMAVEDFLNYRYEKVFVVFTDFISTLVQKPNMVQLLPFTDHVSRNTYHVTDLLIEPGPSEVFENLIVRTIEFTVYQALVESSASEHSARMVAMRNANEAAGDMIDDLTLSGNLARQAGITRELSEISAAKLAMEGN